MFTDNFQEKIWRDKYQYKNEMFDEYCKRIAYNVFGEEEKEYRKKLLKYLKEFKILFGGRTNSNIGIEENGVTLFNCFISPTVGNPDSLEGILELANNYAITLKTEGGVGFCANFFRPANTLIRKIGVTTPGSVKFLELFDKLSEIITSGNVNGETSYQGEPTKKSIRKGATMVTMSISHPDIEDFITAKATPNRLTKMNMSVLITDAFICAIENDLDWDLWFPDINFEKYDEEWDGDFEKWAGKGYPYVVYKTIKAVDLWDLLLKNSYSRSEPGILFIDNIRKMDNLHYLENCSILSTNPCLAGDVRLHTENGTTRLDELCKLGKENKVVVDNRVINGNLGVVLLPATAVYKTGENKDVYRVKTNTGYELKATDYHEFYTTNGKKALKNLVVNDELLICDCSKQFTDKIKLIEYVGKEDIYCLTQPDHNSIIVNGIVASNCGEIPGSTGKVIYNNKEYLLGDVCCLGSINLTMFYDVKTEQFNYEDFLNAVEILIRGLDNVIEVSNYPLKIYEDAAKLKRKIGMGVTGVGSLMMMMNIRYGSDECIGFLDDLLSKMMNKAYQTSALMAKEKGSFALYDKKLLEGGYVKNSGVLSEKTVEMIRKYGLRHSALSAIAPCGTLSIVAGNVSSGLEPVFAKEFKRWNRVEGKKVDFKYPDVHKKEWFETDYFKEQNVADEVVLMSGDKKYRIDKNNGLCEQIVIKDYGYNIALKSGFTEMACATDLDVGEHLKVLTIFSKFIDLSCSKTINLPTDISFEDFKKLYGEIHSLGIKGCTTYREGTSVAILETEKRTRAKNIKKQQKEFIGAFKDQEDNDLIVQSVCLPEEYPAKGYILQSEGKKWYVHVAFKDKALKKPFALFVNTNNREDNVLTFDALERLEDVSKSLGLNGERIEEVKRKYAYQKNPVKICRMIGFLLRHNVSILNIVQALDGVEQAAPGTFVFRIKKFLCQFIDKIDDPIICPACGEKALIFSEGCFKCNQCGNSRCG